MGLNIKLKPLLAFLPIVLLSAPQAFAYTEYWEIDSFHSEITISEDNKMTVKETIFADFTNEEHRGILRAIPYDYEWGLFGTKTVEVELIEENALNEKNEPWFTYPYEENGYLNIEATTQDSSPLTGPATFIFHYYIKDIIQPFDEHDELYWNVNGPDWPVKTNEVSAIVTIPEKIDPNDVKLECFTGEYSASGEDCEFKIENDHQISFKTTRPFNEYENLTIVLGLPKGFIAMPPLTEKLADFLAKFWPFFVPVIVFLFLFIKWYLSGRDEKTNKDTIIPHYKAPEGLTATETGALYDEKIHSQDIIAAIIDYAIKGYIRINEIETKGLIKTNLDYELELLKPYTTTKKFEKFILETIFPKNETGEKIKLNHLARKFPLNLKKIQKSIMEDLVENGYFPHNPDSVRAIYMTVGGIILAIGIYTFIPIYFISMIATGIIIMFMGQIMPRKTEKGSETLFKLKGLYEYINTAEKDRMKFQEKNNLLFEKLLPYAMAFGLVKKWTNAFDGIIKTPPTWYTPAHPWSMHNFSMHNFSKKISAVSTKMGNFSTPGSRGGGGAWGGGSGFSGGFSGGGFGGGGGRGL